MSETPKISCLTITKDRLISLKQSIRNYCDQDYPTKELLIITDGTPWFVSAIQRHLAHLNRSDIRVEWVKGSFNLGQLRNLSLEKATGEFLCQWDDDDQYHPHRLSIQFAHLKKQQADACFLTDQLHYLFKQKELYWLDWRKLGDSPRYQIVPGSLMMKRSLQYRYPESGPFCEKGEDDAMVDQLFGQVSITGLSGAGYLYVYTNHGQNTFSDTHHLALALRLAADHSFFFQNMQNFTNALPYYQLPMPYTIVSKDRKVAIFNEST